MHHVHTSRGFIIGSKPYGEASKIIFIFTRDFGLISALAEGIRLEKSKLRYSTQDFSIADFSLVKGREFWRIVGSLGIDKKLDFKREKIKISILSPVALILKRMIHGEGAYEEIFDDIESSIDFINNQESINHDHLQTLESVLIMRILQNLGYLNRSVIEDKLVSSPISETLLDSLKARRLEINKYINYALKESQL